MKTLNLIAIAITASALAAPAFAGPDYAQLAAQKRAFDRAYAAKAATAPKALAGATGPQGQLGPTTKSVAAPNNIGHPTERVRR